jgi:uncharacterized protein with PIN domain
VAERTGETFLCDAMLGGLAKWLRAAGYRAIFDVHARDGDLVRRAYEEGHWLVTSDSGILERHAVARRLVRCVFVPLGLSTAGQLGHVLAATGLPLRSPRCMVCGGQLVSVEASEVAPHVPPKVRASCEDYFVCADCGGVYWRGSHWESISSRLLTAARLARQVRAQPRWKGL